MNRAIIIKGRGGEPLNLIADYVAEHFSDTIAKLEAFEFVSGKAIFLGADEDEIVAIRIKADINLGEITNEELSQLLAAIKQVSSKLKITLIAEEE